MTANLCSGVYFIRSAATGTVVHVSGHHRPLVGSAMDPDQAGSQLFEFKRIDDRYLITNVGTKLAVDLSDGKAEDSTKIMAWSYNGNRNQQWRMERIGDEKSSYYMITNVMSGTAMDLYAFGIANGTPVVGYTANKFLNQKWEFIGATEYMLGKRLQIPGPERVVEKVVPGPERVVEKLVPGPERVVMIPGPERVIEKLVPGPERVVERVIPGPERVVEKLIPGPERVVVMILPGSERKVEKEVPGLEKLVQDIVVKCAGNNHDLVEMDDLKDRILGAVTEWSQTRSDRAKREQ
ncbi:ricin B lectin domain-containing protein [Trichophaea hybrida]|nr:ricin B lectin domain-containing protein [Trichophaea hybrida]